MYFKDYDEKLRLDESRGTISKLRRLMLSPDLEAVNLSDNNISSLEGMEILKRIKHLNLCKNKLKETSLEPIRYCIELQHLDLRRNQIASLASLPVLPNLKYLSLGGNQLKETSFEPLGYCLELQYLGLFGNEISSLATMPVLPNLKQLILSENQITSLAGLPVLPNLKQLDLDNNNISTLTGFPILPSLEKLSIDGPILGIPHVEAALILLVGPSLKLSNCEDVLASDREVVKQYPAHTSFCIRNGWSICDPEVASESIFSFLTELWKERTPPCYTLREAFTDQPFEEDACTAHFSFSHFYGNNYGLVLKYQWFIGDTILANFSPINGETDSVYWPKKENVGKYLKVECTSMLGGVEFPPIFAMGEPVLSGTGIPKVVDINVIGELMEGKILKGSVKIAWCGSTPGKGASSWLRRRLNNSEIIPGAEEEEYELTLDDVDAHIVYAYTPITQEGLKGESTNFTTGFIKAGKEEQEKAISASAKNVLAKSIGDDRKQWEAAFYEEVRRREKIEEELANLKKESIECCIRFTFQELEKATDNFNESHKLGEGGFGIVYKGFLRHTHVAVKMLTNNLYQNTRGFKEEIETLVRARHPNLVTLIGASEEGSEKLALVYEFVEGGSLQDQLFKGKNDSHPPLSWRTRIRIASDICSALIFLHSTPRVHGDLKPDNILLDSNYVSKLSDFGTCRVLKVTDDTYTPWYATTKIGAATEGYMDPLYHQTWTLTAKSDVYAFGIVLLQLVTGRYAYKILPFVENVIKEKNIDRMIDLSAGWPRNNKGQFVEARKLADLGLKCARLNPYDRADLAKDVWNVLESLKDVAFDN